MWWSSVDHSIDCSMIPSIRGLNIRSGSRCSWKMTEDGQKIAWIFTIKHWYREYIFTWAVWVSNHFFDCCKWLERSSLKWTVENRKGSLRSFALISNFTKVRILSAKFFSNNYFWWLMVTRTSFIASIKTTNVFIIITKSITVFILALLNILFSNKLKFNCNLCELHFQ